MLWLALVSALAVASALALVPLLWLALPWLQPWLWFELWLWQQPWLWFHVLALALALVWCFGYLWFQLRLWLHHYINNCVYYSLISFNIINDYVSELFNVTFHSNIIKVKTIHNFWFQPLLKIEPNLWFLGFQRSLKRCFLLLQVDKLTWPGPLNSVLDMMDKKTIRFRLIPRIFNVSKNLKVLSSTACG